MIEPLHDDVIEALKKALQQDAEIRLVSAGAKNPGLLAGSKGQSVALTQCLNPQLQLFHVRESQEKTTKSTKQVHHVRIAPSGIEMLVRAVKPDQYEPLIATAAESLKDVVREVVLRVAGEQVADMSEQRRRLLDRQQSLIDFVSRLIDIERQSITQEMERLRSVEESLARFQVKSEPQAKPIEKEEKPQTESSQPLIKPRSPQGEADIDFQRDVAENLVYAWEDAGDQPDVREALERVMLNLGIDPLGAVGDVVEFDGRFHQSSDRLNPGDPAIIDQPGWELTNSRGKKLLARARVRKSPTPAEAHR